MRGKILLVIFTVFTLSICAGIGSSKADGNTLKSKDGKIKAFSRDLTATAAVATQKQKNFVCGPDVTDHTYKLLGKIIDDYDDVSNWRKYTACWNLLNPNTAVSAWDMYPFSGGSIFDIHTIAPKCQVPRGKPEFEFQCERTISFEFRCIHLGRANYLFWGIAGNLCDDEYLQFFASSAYNYFAKDYPEDHPTPKAQEMFVELGAAYVDYYRAERAARAMGASPESSTNAGELIQQLEEATPAWNSARQEFKNKMYQLDREEKACRLACFLPPDKTDEVSKLFGYQWEGVTDE